MRAAVLADVHGNREALEAVLADAARQGVDVHYCLGDVIGYGADPEACLDLVARTCTIVVRGNHEEAWLHPQQRVFMNAAALASMRWTEARVDETARRLAGSWPLVYAGGDARLVHASPARPRDFPYLHAPEAVAAAFDAFPESLCLVGHTHVPGVARAGSSGTFGVQPDPVCDLTPGSRYLINVGSVGQPRDGDSRACWAFVTDAPPRVEIRRVAYDLTRTQTKIIRAGLPEILAVRLGRGY